MPFTLWSQDIFSKGELSPFMYARVTVNEYQNGLKTAQNVLTYPTGAAGKRFGTFYNSTLTGFTDFQQINFGTFQYLNECVYQILFGPLAVYIYLEGLLVATVVTTLTALNVYNMSTTTIGAIFRCAGQGFRPQDLTRAPNVGVTIASFTTNTFTTSAPAFIADRVMPVKITATGGTIMQTNPQITAGVTYFVAATSTTTAALFQYPEEAKAYLINPSDTSAVITISSLGTGTSTVTVQNTWTFGNATFKSLPVYDFNGATTSYDTITFTPSATTGSAVTITLSAAYAPLTVPSAVASQYIGGAFFGGGGSGRIVSVASTTQFTVAVSNPFDSTSAILGSLALLAEPAWSDARGWPQVCSSYQNRALFANTTSLPNGFFASVINDYTDFGDLTADDDDAISWYPTSDNMNFIRFIVPYRSITVHTNTGIYSSPLSDIAAITPSNFTLQLQDSTPADVLQPQAIDNQIVVLSGNDAHQMLWDGINNAYTSNIVSVINEQVIRDPQDETAFQPLHRAGSRFVFIVNLNGSLAVFQTLISQSVAGFTPQIMEQSYGNVWFLQVGSSSDGRCWFVVQREIAAASTAIDITAFIAPDILVAAHNFDTTAPTAVKFLTTGTLPASTPALNTTNYFWVVGVQPSEFKVYLTQEDAIADENAFVFTDFGTNSQVEPWALTTVFTLEELTNDVFLDCAIPYFGTPTDTVTTGPFFNAQDIKMVGDGFGFVSHAEDNVNNEVVFVAHGIDTPVSEAYIGFPIRTVMEPMPLSISSGPSAKETTLTQPKHIRWVRFMFNNTIGGTINGKPIALAPFDQAHIGDPPVPARGYVEMSIMKGWDDFNNPTFTIEHDEPFDIQLLGIFYSVEI
jgi:hypothetical protein